MENGFDGKLADKFSDLELSDPHNSSGDSDSLYLITKAVEAAETSIKQQVSLSRITIIGFLAVWFDLVSKRGVMLFRRY